MIIEKGLKRYLILAFLLIGIGILFVGTNPASANTSVQGKAIDWVWPVAGQITDTYGTRSGNHKGLDIAADRGDTILSVDEGTVQRSYYSDTYGHVVFISHPSGLETVYAHMSKRGVHEGEKVKSGQKIGEIGSTGISTGDHLHFEVHNGEWNYEKSNAIDPLIVLNQSHTHTQAETEESKKKELAIKLAASERLVNYAEVGANEGIEGNSEASGDSVFASKVQDDDESPMIIKVVKNDTLWDISIEHQVAVDSIMAWNNLETSTISVGQELKLYPDNKNTYIVQLGDSLEHISKKVGISVENIRQLNNIQGHIIHPNQVLILSKNK